MIERSSDETTEWVCEPRQVWTWPTWTGWTGLEMSKMRMPRKRSSEASGPTP